MSILLKLTILIFLVFLNSTHAKNLEKISLQLSWKYQFQFAGFIMAKELGYYKDIGLDVAILEYDADDNVEKLLSHKVDFLVSNGMILYKNKKLQNAILLATYFQRSPLVLITQPEIKNVLDIKGKNIVISKNDIYNSSLSMLLEYFSINGKNTNFINPSFSLENFIDKKVDAVTGFKSNELFVLDELNVSYNIIDPVEYGFSTNAINLFTLNEKVKKRPGLIHDFLLATKRGWEYSLEHIDEVALLIHKKYTPSKSFKHLQYEGEITKELMLRDLYNIGEINEGFVNKTYTQLLHSKRLYPTQKHTNLVYKNFLTNSQAQIDFSDSEMEWMKKKQTIRYSEIDWKPLSIIEDGKMRGILGEYLDIIAKKTGIEFELIPSNFWSEVLEKFKNEEIDIIPGVGSSSHELEMGDVSMVYAKYPMGIITGYDYSYIDSLKDIKDKVIAVPKYYSSYNFIVENYPDIKLLPTKTIEEALLHVASGQADAFVGHIATALHYITQLNLTKLKVSGTTAFEFQHRYLIQKNHPELTSIINKVFKSINEHERNSINSRWITTKVEEQVDMSLIYQIVAISTFIVFLFIVRQRTLGKYNGKLRTLKERMDLALDGNRDVIWDWNLLTNNLYVSPRWKEVTGYGADGIETEIKIWKKYIHPDDFRKIMRAIFNNINGKSQYLDEVHRYRHKEGNWVWIHIRGKTIYDENKKAVRMIGTHTDITVQRELELKYTHQAQIIEQIHDSVISTDLQGYISSWNSGSQQLLGYSSDEVLGKHINFIYPEENLKDLEKNIQVLKSIGEQQAETKLLKKSQNIIDVHISLSLLRDENLIPIGMVGYCQDISKRKKVEQELIEQKNILAHQANHDALTDLPNRILFNDRLEQGIEKAKRKGEKLALFFIDLDHFKEINDSLGHSVGDEILVAVTTLLKKTIRQKDTLARLGGDEFTVIIEELNGISSATSLARKILKVLSQPISIGGNVLYVSSSIGISLYPNDGVFSSDLLKYADAAMYRAKDEGRNNFQFYSSEMTELALERIVMESNLRRAIQNKEFVIAYQPQVDAVNNTLLGMEALIRWQHPTMGLISPAKFIPLAESTGLIIEIDQYVMKTAMKQFSEWYGEGLNPGILSLNLAVKQLKQKNFIDIVQSMMRKTEVKPSWLELEVTEGQIMTNPEEAIKVLTDISNLGIELAIDDFGTGYSSLSYLKKLPIKKLKIDQSFVKDLPDDEEDVAIAKAVIALAKSLNLKIIAEGVETKEQKEFLVSNGCHNIQGYLYSKPVSAQEIKKILLNGLEYN